MPMMRDTPPPLPADVLRDLRASLAPSYGNKLVEHEGRLVLAVRVPSEIPDRERDVARAADYVSDDAVALCRDVLLIGAEKLVRLDPIPLRDAVRERLQDDLPTSKEARRSLQRAYGATLFNPAAKPREVAIAVRVPRANVKETSTEDLAALQQALGPVLSNTNASRVTMCYLVADNDYRRCPPEEFARILRGETALRPPKVNTYAVAGDARSGQRTATAGSFSGSPFGMLMTQAAHMDTKMEANKQKRAAPAPTPAPAPALHVPTPAVAPAPQPALANFAFPGVPAPSPSPAPPAAPMAFAQPTPAPLAPYAASPADETFADPIAALGEQLGAHGFEVIREVHDLGLSLAAHQPNGKRIIVQQVAEGTPGAVQQLTKLCAELEADAGLLVAETLAPGTWLEAAGTKVEVLPAAALGAWTL
jgi:hypothetical protein